MAVFLHVLMEKQEDRATQRAKVTCLVKGRKETPFSSIQLLPNALLSSVFYAPLDANAEVATGDLQATISKLQILHLNEALGVLGDFEGCYISSGCLRLYHNASFTTMVTWNLGNFQSVVGPDKLQDLDPSWQNWDSPLLRPCRPVTLHHSEMLWQTITSEILSTHQGSPVVCVLD